MVTLGKALENHRGITTLDVCKCPYDFIAGNHVTNEGMRALGKILLSPNTRLEALNVSHNTISVDAAKEFTEALKGCHTLKKLCLSPISV